MTKVNEVVIDALEDLVVQQEEAPIEQSEGKAAIRVLNDMMAMWDAQGISLGYTEVSDLGDTITVPPGAVQGIKANLAIFLAPKYETEPSAAVIAKAKRGYDAILSLAVSITPMQYPGTLPQGSGNTYPGYADNTFFPDLEDTILTETGGSIGLEEDTESS